MRDIQSPYGYVPFYMNYPYQNYYFEEQIKEWDRDKILELYPKESKKIQSYIEEECDRLEGEGSYMYDEYPDYLRLQKTVLDIYHRIYPMEDIDPGKKDVIQILYCQELMHRRQKRRRNYRMY